MEVAYKTIKFIEEGEDGQYRGMIEQIEGSKNYDILDLCNRRRNLWVFSLFNGYRQIGQFKVHKPHNFKEGDLVIATKEKGNVVKVQKEKITVDNVKDVFKD